MSRASKKLGKGLAHTACGLAALLGVIRVVGQEALPISGLPSGLLDPRPGLHLGRFDIHGGVTENAAYDDFVQLSSTGGQQSDFTWTTSPFVMVRTEGPNARTLSLAYAPSYVAYTDHSELNALNHQGTFNLVFPFNRLTLSLAQEVTIASVIVRDIANRATEEMFKTTGTANYQVSDRTSLEGLINYTRSDYGASYSSYQQWNEEAFADYHFSDKLSVGAGFNVNQFVVQNAPGQTSEGPAIRASYRPSAAISLSASADVSFQQFGGGAPDSIAEDFQLSGTYQVRAGTRLSLTALRSDQPSGFAFGENYTLTSFSLGVSQALPHNTTVSLTGGYNEAAYYSAFANISTSRADNYYLIRGDLSYTFARDWTAGFFAEHDSNASTLTGFDYDHNIVGLRAGWSF